MCNEFCVSFWCGPCAICQLSREMSTLCYPKYCWVYIESLITIVFAMSVIVVMTILLFFFKLCPWCHELHNYLPHLKCFRFLVLADFSCTSTHCAVHPKSHVWNRNFINLFHSCRHVVMPSVTCPPTLLSILFASEIVCFSGNFRLCLNRCALMKWQTI